MTDSNSGDGEVSPGGDPTVDDPTESGPTVRRLAEWDADSLLDLASTYETPLYLIDTDRVWQNCTRLQEAFPDADVRYAAKAHTGRSVLETVREAGLDAECASAGEVARAIAAGFSGDRIHYTAVFPPDRDLEHVVDVWADHPDLTITVGAADTLDRLVERGYDGRVCLRVNPGVGAGHHEKVKTGGHEKFGIPPDRAVDLASDTRHSTDPVEVVGIHAHAGSGISGEDLANHRELVRRMGDLAREMADAGIDLEYVDVGGGFGVPYRETEPPLDLQAVAEATRDALGDVDAQLAIEPGRYVVADAGLLLTRVNTIKPMPGTTVVGVDAGMTDLLRPAMYDAYHPIRNVSAALPGEERDEIGATVAGPICESADVFCTNRPLAAPERGDVLAIGLAGAYGYEMASQYNSRPRPAEVALDADGDPRLVRRRETLADLTRVEAQPDADDGAGEP